MSTLPRTLSSQTFFIKSDKHGLYVMHWGRCINKSPGKHNTDYYRDLEKMLTLSSSDKTAQVTGKFGLGFKSVFFLSDTPQIISGNLAVEIVGGVYPKRLSDSDFLRLRDELANAKHGDEKQGTLIYLPTDEKREEVAGLLEKFRHLAPYMLLFTRVADRCEIITGENEHKTIIRWQKEAEKLPKKVIKKRCNDKTVLQFKTNVGSVVFKVGRDGIQPFKSDEKIPTLWVTAPTEEHSKLGFLINGDFDVDVGRAQLARSSEKNKTTAQQMAGELAEAFKKLADMDCKTLSSALALDVSKEDFWRSFFDCLTQGFDDDKPVLDLAKRIFWDEQGAASWLFNEYKVLPNGLTGELTQLSDVKHYVSGLLARDFAKFKSWLPKSHNIISQRVFNALKRCHVPTEAKVLTLEHVLKAKLGNQVTPDTAQELGQVITRQWLEQPQQSDTFNEMNELRTFLNQLLFQAQDGGHYRAAQLLSTSERTSLEAKRASIAPPKRRLHQDYQGAALNFFNVCRGDSAITLDEIAKWVLNASSEQERKNAVDCILADAALSTHLSEHSRVGQRWLNDEKLSWLAPKDLYRLRALLRLSWQSFDEEEDTHSFQLVDPDPERLLERVYDRWTKNVAQKKLDYDDTVYPFSLDLRLDYDLDDELQRKSWLVLFMRASFITLGWDKPGRHRGFLQFCEQEGWLDVFSKKTENPDPHEWMGVIDAYFDKDSGKYRHWMTQFVTIYQLSKWLDNNVSLVTQLSQAKERHNIEGIWQPRTLSTLSGFGDYDLPSLMKPLRLGKHFIMRELVRKDVLNNPALYPYCFVPSSRTRQAFIEMGCQVGGEDTMTASRQIYEFAKEYLGAKRATFDMDFDLPFYYGLHKQ